MFNTENILVRLQNGETPESIAAEMSTALNEASKAYEIQTAKATRDAVLEAAAGNLIDALLNYTNLVCPEFATQVSDEEVEELTSLLVTQADAIGDLIKFALALGKLENMEIKVKPCCDKTLCGGDKKTSDEVISEFLLKNFLS